MKTTKKNVDSDPKSADLIAPDGGYSWLIVIAYGTANILIVPILTSFGLIFKDKFQQLNLSALDAALILNLNSALGMTLGLFNGALLKCFGYRKIAVVGGCLFSSGLIATSFANCFQHFLITYSIITSIGMGLCTSSFSLAVNSYFNEKRDRAFSIGVTISGLGPIIFPQLISYLLGVYGSQGCVLIIGGIAMNIIPAAVSLQPVKWHMKKVEKIDDETKLKKPLDTTISLESSIVKQKSLDSISDDEEDYLDTCPIYHDIDSQSIYGIEVIQHPFRKSEEILWKDLNYKFEPPTLRTTPDTGIGMNNSGRPESAAYSSDDDDCPQRPLRWFESPSEHSIHLASSLSIYQEPKPKIHENFFAKRVSIMMAVRRASMHLFPRRNTTIGTIDEEETPPSHRPPPLLPPHLMPKEKVSKFQPIKNGWKRFVRIFDLGLLTDKIYLNMMIGIAIAVFAEINFSLLTPFILNEFEYTTEQIAIFMSTLASVDICCRFLSPYIGRFFKQPPRIMYMYALVMLIISRTTLLFAQSYNEIILVATGLGLAKGMRTVYMNLVVPSYIPLNRLAAASGIQMVANGVILLSMGSFVGIFHDLFGSYKVCILFINLVTLTTLILWTIELVIMKRRNMKKAKAEIVCEIPKLENYKVEVH